MKHRAMKSLTAFALLVLPACSKLPIDDLRTSKEQATDRWSQVRARLKYQLAEESFNAGRLDDAQVQLDEAIGLDRQAAQPYVLLSRVLLERGQTAAAAMALEQAVTSGGATAETDYLNGVIAQHYGKFQPALEYYRQASEREPANAHYVVATAETLVALNRAAEALALVREHWADFEQNAALRELAGGIYIMLGRYEEAADAYRQARTLSPEDGTLATQLGLALSLAGHAEEARDVLGSVVADAQGENRPLVLLLLGRCQLDLGNANEAKAVLRQATAAAPKQAVAWHWLARASVASGDLLTARQASMQATTCEPDNIEYRLWLGYVCYRQKDLASAASAFDSALDHAPDDRVALYFLGRCREEMGDREAANRCYQHLERISPGRSLLAEKPSSATAIPLGLSADLQSMMGDDSRSP